MGEEEGESKNVGAGVGKGTLRGMSPVPSLRGGGGDFCLCLAFK